MTQSTFLWEEPHASLLALQALEKDSKTLEETSCSHMLEFLTSLDPSGAFGKTCQVCSVATEDGILVPSSGRWANSGMGGPTECWTLSTSEHAAFPEPFPSGDAVCSLSDILETGDLPQRYFLTPRACAGILRRAGKRGKELPPLLRRALEAVVGSEPTSNSSED